jgi:ATP-dependent RNA helicase A
VNEGRYLRPMHKNLAGRRHSDHVALLLASHQWLRAKYRGEDAEREFCERRALNMQLMRMTYEAKSQLKDIMSLSGFPDECLTEHPAYDVHNADTKLDLVNSLLAYALYPNVCFHVDKRKLTTADGKQALIHKNSVNCGREIASFPSPFFVFGEKIKTRAVSAKCMSMVTPAQLLMFASDKVETCPMSDGSLICLDGWIYLQMSPQLAAAILSLRTAMDRFLVDCLLDQNHILTAPRHLTLFSEALTMLSDLNNFHVSFSKVNDQRITDAINTTSTNYNSRVYEKSASSNFDFDNADDNGGADDMSYSKQEDDDGQPQAKRFFNSNNNSQEDQKPSLASPSTFFNRGNGESNNGGSFGQSGGRFNSTGRGGGFNQSRGGGQMQRGGMSAGGGGNCFKCGESGHFSRECPKNVGGFSGGRGGAFSSGGRGGFGGQTGFRNNNNSFGQQQPRNNSHNSFAAPRHSFNPASNGGGNSGMPLPPHLMKQSPSSSGGFDNTQNESFGDSGGGNGFNQQQQGGFGGFGRGGGGGGRGGGRGFNNNNNRFQQQKRF